MESNLELFTVQGLCLAPKHPVSMYKTFPSETSTWNYICMELQSVNQTATLKVLNLVKSLGCECRAEAGSRPDLPRILSLVCDSFIVSLLTFIFDSFLQCHFEKFLSAGTSHAH